MVFVALKHNLNYFCVFRYKECCEQAAALKYPFSTKGQTHSPNMHIMKKRWGILLRVKESKGEIFI